MEEVFAADKIKEELILPGFRFHPTDEELVGFYLRRKVGRKPLCIELIRDVDIYKYDPWDLPKMSSTMRDKEWYFFCVRGRKYRNSVRPNRVTGSGFWKATGIDKPIYSSGQTHECIGLKKSLVFYRGAAGKGTKTDWMMHEFRLPPSCRNANQSNPKNISCEAEVWTICRIFKKIESSYKRYKSDWKNTSTTESFADTINSKSYSLESENRNYYTNAEGFADHQHKIMNVALVMHMNPKNHFPAGEQISAAHESSYSSSSRIPWDINGDEFFKDGKWDELRSVVDLASDPSSIYHSS